MHVDDAIAFASCPALQEKMFDVFLAWLNRHASKLVSIARLGATEVDLLGHFTSSNGARPIFGQAIGSDKIIHAKRCLPSHEFASRSIVLPNVHSQHSATGAKSHCTPETRSPVRPHV